jgi:hypothetical protein
MFDWILRIYSYAYHLGVSLFLVVVGAIALLSENVTFQLRVLPWGEPTLNYVVLPGGVVGLLSLALVVAGKVRFLFPVWALVVLIMMVRGFFLAPYAFRSAGDFWWAVWLTLGAVGALIGALIAARRRRYPA